MSGALHWERQRNDARARVKWMFDVTRARQKLGRVYPVPMPTNQTRAA